MKQSILLMLVLLLVAIPSVLATETLLVSDNFDDNSVNATIWGTNNGGCVETGGRIFCHTDNSFINLEDFGLQSTDSYRVSFDRIDYGVEGTGVNPRLSVCLLSGLPDFSESGNGGTCRQNSGTQHGIYWYSSNQFNAHAPNDEINLEETTGSHHYDLIRASNHWKIKIDGIVVQDSTVGTDVFNKFVVFGVTENDQDSGENLFDNVQVFSGLPEVIPSPTPSGFVITDIPEGAGLFVWFINTVVSEAFLTIIIIITVVMIIYGMVKGLRK